MFAAETRERKMRGRARPLFPIKPRRRFQTSSTTAGGVIVRAAVLSDGLVRFETWKNSAWLRGGADWGGFLTGPALSDKKPVARDVATLGG